MPSAKAYLKKLAEQDAPKVKTTRAQEIELEQERMNNPRHLDYEQEFKNTIRITAEEKLKFKFLREVERLLREFKIPYDYIRTDFVFVDQAGYGFAMWFDQYDDVTDHIFVGAEDKSEYYESFNNEMDAINYITRELDLPALG